MPLCNNALERKVQPPCLAYKVPQRTAYCPSITGKGEMSPFFFLLSQSKADQQTVFSVASIPAQGYSVIVGWDLCQDLPFQRLKAALSLATR